jgi:hypothetical protein
MIHEEMGNIDIGAAATDCVNHVEGRKQHVMFIFCSAVDEKSVPASSAYFGIAMASFVVHDCYDNFQQDAVSF